MAKPLKRRLLLGGGAIIAAAGIAVAVAAGSDSPDPGPVGPTPTTAPPEDRGEVIARVDGAPIYSLDAQARLASVKDVHTAVEAELPAEVRATVFTSLVNDVIVKREAKRRHIELTADELIAEVSDVIEMAGGEEGLDEWLAGQGITRAELERRVNLTITWERVKAAIVADVKVSDDQLRTYYDEHLDEFGEEGDRQSFIEVKASLEAKLLDERQAETFAQWVEERRNAAKVEVLADEWKDVA